jgi:hypothetical protein
MFLADQTNATAWQSDLQYMWGNEMLVAPNLSDGGNNVSAWLPAGTWYYFWDDTKYTGNTTQNILAATGVVPAFVRAGALIPMAPFAKSTFFIPNNTLILHAYAGADGTFQLYEDDNVTEKFRTTNELRATPLSYTQQDLGVQIGAAQGTYAGAATSRTYQVVYHGLSAAASLFINGTAIPAYASQAAIPAGKDGAVWDATKKLLNVYVASRAVDGTVRISTSSTATGTGGATGSGAGGGGGGGSGGAGNGDAGTDGGALSTGGASGGGGMTGGSGGSTGSGTGSGGSSSPPGAGGGGSGCGCDLGMAAGSAGLPPIAGVLGVALAGLATRRRRKTRGRIVPPS